MVSSMVSIYRYLHIETEVSRVPIIEESKNKQINSGLAV